MSEGEDNRDPPEGYDGILKRVLEAGEKHGKL